MHLAWWALVFLNRFFSTEGLEGHPVTWALPCWAGVRAERGGVSPCSPGAGLASLWAGDGMDGKDRAAAIPEPAPPARRRVQRRCAGPGRRGHWPKVDPVQPRGGFVAAAVYGSPQNSAGWTWPAAGVVTRGGAGRRG